MDLTKNAQQGLKNANESVKKAMEAIQEKNFHDSFSWILCAIEELIVAARNLQPQYDETVSKERR